VDWVIDGGELRLDVVVPPSATADVVLPGRMTEHVGSGARSFRAAVSDPLVDAPDPLEERV
jgi:hypothetical protein